MADLNVKLLRRDGTPAIKSREAIPAAKKGVILETLPGIIAHFMKVKYGRGPETQKVYFNDNDVVVYIYGFLNKKMMFWDGSDIDETVRKYYYALTKADIEGIRKYFMHEYNVQIERVFCDFDINANEGVFVFRPS